MKKFPALSPTVWLTAKNLFTQGFSVLLFAVQAPVLGPRAFGLISIVMVFVGFCETVLGEAVPEALISIREIEAAHFDTMNTVITGVSVLFGAAAFVGADWASHLFREPELAPILKVMAVLPVLSSLAAAPTASTKRDMNFQPVAVRGMASLFAGGTIGLALTLAGFGVWALVWQALFTRLASTVVIWMAVPLRLRFGFSPSHFRELMRFALPTLLSRAMAWATGQFPRLVFGLYWGATELGLFGLASRLCDILLELALVPRYAVARVDLRQHEGDTPGLIAAVRGHLINFSAIAFPLCIGAAAVVPTLFRSWLDARWAGAVVPSQLMMLMCVPFVTHYCSGAILLALNRQKSEALMAIAQTVITVVMVLLFAPFGLVVATAAFSARPLIALPLPAWLVWKRCGVPRRVLFGAQAPALVAALAMGLGVTALRLVLENHVPSLALLPLLVVSGAVLYAVGLNWLLPEFLGRYTRKFLRR